MKVSLITKKQARHLAKCQGTLHMYAAEQYKLLLRDFALEPASKEGSAGYREEYDEQYDESF